MSLSDKELDRQTLKLVRCLILKTTKEKKKWFAGWQKSELINDGYSELVVKKAIQSDLYESSRINALNAVIWPLLALMDGILSHRVLALVFIAL